MNNYKFYFSRRIAEDKICDAKTPEQVKAAMRKSCELCQKAGQYNPRWPRCRECLLRDERLRKRNSRVRERRLQKRSKSDRKYHKRRRLT